MFPIWFLLVSFGLNGINLHMENHYKYVNLTFYVIFSQIAYATHTSTKQQLYAVHYPVHLF